MGVEEPSVTMICGGDVNPARFVTKSSTDHQVTQATADAIIFGVSQANARDAPIPSASTLAGTTNDPIKVYIPPARCYLNYGGTITAGNEIVSNASGQGVALTATGAVRENIGAICLEGGSSGDTRRVALVRDAVSGAIAAS